LRDDNSETAIVEQKGTLQKASLLLKEVKYLGFLLAQYNHLQSMGCGPKPEHITHRRNTI